jgi:hypothetical protein
MYDDKCYKLASDFLEDYPQLNTEQNRSKLAEEIQTLIEDFIRWEQIGDD